MYVHKITAPKCRSERQKFIDPNDLRMYAMGTAVHTGMQDIWYVYMHVYFLTTYYTSLYLICQTVLYMVQITQYTLSRRYTA